MNNVTRRSVLGIMLPGAVLGLAWAGPAKAAADQPHMEAALEALRTALRQLEAATSDKGGHRVRAMRHVRNAIAEVEKGIRFDRRR